MERKEFTLFASTLNKSPDCYMCNALDKEYNTTAVSIMADEESGAVRCFQESDIYEQFSLKNIGACVYTYIKTQDDSSFHRADLVSELTNL